VIVKQRRRNLFNNKRRNRNTSIQQKKKQEIDAEIIKLRPGPRDYRGYRIIKELRVADKEFKDKLAMDPFSREFILLVVFNWG
jgi:NAD+--asparagine ADP-ribosyltransferase